MSEPVHIDYSKLIDGMMPEEIKAEADRFFTEITCPSGFRTMTSRLLRLIDRLTAENERLEADKRIMDWLEESRPEIERLCDGWRVGGWSTELFREAARAEMVAPTD